MGIENVSEPNIMNSKKGLARVKRLAILFLYARIVNELLLES